MKQCKNVFKKYKVLSPTFLYFHFCELMLIHPDVLPSVIFSFTLWLNFFNSLFWGIDSSLILHDQRNYFESFWIYWDMCGLGYGLSWSMFHVLFRRMNILLLLECSIYVSWLILKSTIDLLIFCLLVLLDSIYHVLSVFASCTLKLCY